MTDEEAKKEFNDLRRFMKGDLQAATFCANLLYVAHLWDDLIDKDVSRTDAEINDAFRIMLADIPMNPFYDKHRYHLVPLMKNAVLAWLDANVLEHGDDNEKCLAFMMRNELLNVMAYCLTLVGGDEWASEKGLEFRRYYARGFKAKFSEFLKEMRDA